MFRKLGPLFILIALLRHHILCADWMDADVVEVRNDLKEWLVKNPRKAILKCSLTDHVRAIEQVRHLDERQSKKALAAIQNLFLKSSDKVFIGLHETLQALRGKRANSVLISKHTFISVYDFRNFFTGRHEYIACEGINCLSQTSFTDGTDYGSYYLAKCIPFADFHRRFFGRHGVSLSTLNTTTPFFEGISAVGGFFEGTVHLSELPVREKLAPGSYRKGFRHNKTETDYVEV